jgi:hypothetical protein
MYVVKLTITGQVTADPVTLQANINTLKATSGFLGFFPAVLGKVYVLFDTEAHANAFATSEQERLPEISDAEVTALSAQNEVIEKDFYTLSGTDYPYWLRTQLGI